MGASKQALILKNRLVSYSQWYVAKNGYAFGPGAGQSIEMLLENGAKQIQKDSKGLSDTESEKLVLNAEASIRRLVKRMIKERDILPGYAKRNLQVVGEQTLAEALKRLCPLWPICK
jgi:hypothetical protein